MLAIFGIVSLHTAPRTAQSTLSEVAPVSLASSSAFTMLDEEEQTPPRLEGTPEQAMEHAKQQVLSSYVNCGVTELDGSAA